MKSAIEQSIKEKIKSKKGALKLSKSIEDVVTTVNQWLEENAFF
jgi:hypothetical protein